MNAIEFPGVNVRIAEDQPEYETLPAFVGPVPVCMCPVCMGAGLTVTGDPSKGHESCQQCGGQGYLNAVGVSCCFKLTPEELEEANKTGVIWHTVITFGQKLQPQRMSLQRPEWIPTE